MSMNNLNQEFRVTGCHDSWGNVMAWWFSIADHLTFNSDLYVPDSWEYRPSPLGPSNDPDDYVTNVLNETDDNLLLKFGNILERYARNLERHGKNY